MYKTTDSDRECTEGKHENSRPKLKINLTLIDETYNLSPASQVIGPASFEEHRTRVRTYVYANHYCPVCNLLYYFPEQSPEDEISIQRMLDSLKEKV